MGTYSMRLFGGPALAMATAACSLLYDADRFSATTVNDGDAAPEPATEREAGVEQPVGPDSALAHDGPVAPSPEAELDRTLYPADSAYWERSAGGNGHGYFVVKAPGRVGWTLARDAARGAARGHLATLESFAEYAFVKNVVAASSEYFTVRGLKRLGPWIGLERVAPGHTRLAWVTGAPYVHENRAWSSGEPTDDSFSEPYVAFLGFTTSMDVALFDAPAEEEIASFVVEVE